MDAACRGRVVGRMLMSSPVRRPLRGSPFMAPTKTQTVHSKIYWLLIVIAVILGMPGTMVKQSLMACPYLLQISLVQIETRMVTYKYRSLRQRNSL